MYKRYMKTALIQVIMLFTLPFTAMSTVIFSDDFESGLLDQWTIGGRQLAGPNIANTVFRNGSLTGHLYKYSFTEITFAKSFAYDPSLNFNFDMEVSVSSTSPPAPAYYGASGVIFGFLDSGGANLGSVRYIAATTPFLFNLYTSDPANHAQQIPTGIFQEHAYGVGDILANIAINETLVDAVQMTFWTYSSTYPYPVVSAELWVDNVCVDQAEGCNVVMGSAPEPATLALLGAGLAGLGFSRRKKSA